MKISQMTTAQAADVLVRLAEPASSIIHDEGVMKMIETLANDNAISPLKFIADHVTMVVTVLLKDHRSDVFEIVAALAGKTVDEVAEQRITETIKDVRDSWDGDLVDFFGSLK